MAITSLPKRRCVPLSGVWSWTKRLKNATKSTVPSSPPSMKPPGLGCESPPLRNQGFGSAARNPSRNAGTNYRRTRKRARIANPKAVNRTNQPCSGQREAEIQQSEGEAQAAVNASNAEKIARINRAKAKRNPCALLPKPMPKPSVKLPPPFKPKAGGCGQSEDCGTIRSRVQQSCQRKQYADYARQCCRHRQPDFCRHENYRQQQKPPNKP